jgi:PAS domain S-box-containing protein
MSPYSSMPSPSAPLNKLLVPLLAFSAGMSAWALLSKLLPGALVADYLALLLADVGVSALAVAFAAVCACLMLRRAERAHAAQTQNQTMQLLQALIDNTSDAVFAKDREGRYLLFNRAAGQIAGMDPQAVVGHTDQNLFPSLYASIRERDLSVMRLNQPQTFEETLDTPTGKRTFLTTKGPLRDAQGVYGLFGIARDITEMVHARAQLQRSEQRFRLAAADGDVWDWDIASGKAVSQSSFWRRLGFEPPADHEALDWLTMLVHPEDREVWRRALRAHLRDREPYVLEFRARHRNGGWRWFRTQGQALWNEQGRAIYMAGTTHDVTERREMEDALQQTRVELSNLTQRLMAQERETTMRLAHSLHDELGQVLGGARLHLDLALTQADGPDGARRDRLDRVSTLIDHAIAEVRRMLVALRPPSLREQGLAAALDNDIRHGAARGLPVQVLLHVDPQAAANRWPEPVEYAAFMIAREALTNALKHAHAQRVHVSLSSHDGGFELRVDDDGVGIAHELQHGRPGHLGMVGMRERAASIDALFAVERRLSGGTTARLTWKHNSDDRHLPGR